MDFRGGRRDMGELGQRRGGSKVMQIQYISE